MINLDTGFVYGGSVNSKLNEIAIKLNNLALWKRSARNMRDYYKFIERMLQGRSESAEVRAVWN